MANRKEDEFYTMLKEFADLNVEATEEYLRIMETYPDSQADIDRMKDFETAADLQTQKIMDKLYTSFITPIDRSDISDLALAMDDVVDQMNGMVTRLDLFNRSSIRSEAPELARITLHMVQRIRDMFYRLPDYKRDNTVLEMALEIGDVEDEGDKVYHQALYRLFHEEDGETDRVAWLRLFDRMEYVIDACDVVAGIVRNVVMKDA